METQRTQPTSLVQVQLRLNQLVDLRIRSGLLESEHAEHRELMKIEADLLREQRVRQRARQVTTRH